MGPGPYALLGLTDRVVYSRVPYRLSGAVSRRPAPAATGISGPRQPRVGSVSRGPRP